MTIFRSAIAFAACLPFYMHLPAAADTVGGGCGTSQCVTRASGKLSDGPTPEIIKELLKKEISQDLSSDGSDEDLEGGTDLQLRTTSRSSARRLQDLRRSDLHSDPYWEFHRRYLNQSVVSLVVSGQNPNHLEEQLAKLAELKRRGVLIGEIAVVGALWNPGAVRQNRGAQPFLAAAAPKTAAVAAALGSLDAEKKRIVDGNSIVGRLRIENSPTWIVRYRGIDYVYEGVDNPAALFDGQGVFRDAR